MPVPPEYGTFANWFSAVVNVLNVKQYEFNVFQKYWAQLTAAQQAALKTDVVSTINAQVAQLQSIVTYINTL